MVKNRGQYRTPADARLYIITEAGSAIITVLFHEEY